MLATVTPFASFIALILAVFRVANKDRDDRNVRGHVHSGMLLKIGNTELAQSLPGCQETIENKRLVVGAGDGNRTHVRSLGSLQSNSKNAGLAAFLRFSERLNWKIMENGKRSARGERKRPVPQVIGRCMLLSCAACAIRALVIYTSQSP